MTGKCEPPRSSPAFTASWRVCPKQRRSFQSSKFKTICWQHCNSCDFLPLFTSFLDPPLMCTSLWHSGISCVWRTLLSVFQLCDEVSCHCQICLCVTQLVQMSIVRVTHGTTSRLVIIFFIVIVQLLCQHACARYLCNKLAQRSPSAIWNHHQTLGRSQATNLRIRSWLWRQVW